MTREAIDDFLSNKKDIAQRIKNIADKYAVADFVKVTKSSKEYFKNNTIPKINHIYGCLYNEREDYLLLDVDSVERRLTIQYMELLSDILKVKETIDKNFYIVAYHYLTLCKQLGYQLTVANDAPFCFIGDQL